MDEFLYSWNTPSLQKGTIEKYLGLLSISSKAHVAYPNLRVHDTHIFVWASRQSPCTIATDNVDPKLIGKVGLMQERRGCWSAGDDGRAACQREIFKASQGNKEGESIG